MEINHLDYLRNSLESAKMSLEELNITHRINIATYEAKKELLRKQIDSIERQLDK